MSTTSLGDLAQSFMLQKRSVLLRTDLSRLTDELSSGRVSDIKEVLAGNHNYLSGLENSIEVLKGYTIATEEAAILTASMQTSLERVQDVSGKLALDFLLIGGGPIGVVAASPVENARMQLDSVLNTLNDDVAGRSLFAGTATNQAPLPDAETLKNLVLTEIAGQTTPKDIVAAARAWFSDPAGFDAVAYMGSNTPLAPFALSETENLQIDVRANEDSIKEALMNMTVAALADDTALGLSVPEQAELFGIVGINLQANQDQLIDLRARVGFTEERIELISTRNSFEESSSEFARNQLLAADPFETATELENVQFYLQSLYSVTVRNSQLSLVNFL
ncbi:MAG: flagellar hook protein [Roseobacter sp.]